MASLLIHLHFILLIARLGFPQAMHFRAGGQPPLKLFHHSCALKKDEGPCKAILERFYFNTDTRRCESFEFGGCQGNDNNFETLQECEDMCLVKANKSPCHLKDEPGPCRGLVPRYFFNDSTNKCQRFYYGGCFGNANNFQTLKECQDKCQRNNTEEPPSPILQDETSHNVHTAAHDVVEIIQPQTQPRSESEMDICKSPADKGDCPGSEKRFFYNTKTNRCQSFSYSGCGGNRNNFVHKRKCMKTCIKGPRRFQAIRIKTKNSDILQRFI